VLGLNAFIHGTRRERAAVAYDVIAAQKWEQSNDQETPGEACIAREQVASLVLAVAIASPAAVKLLRMMQDLDRVQKSIKASVDTAVNELFSALDCDGAPTISKRQFLRGVIIQPYLLNLFNVHIVAPAAGSPRSPAVSPTARNFLSSTLPSKKNTPMSPTNSKKIVFS
jgi:hypothetical protein